MPAIPVMPGSTDRRINILSILASGNKENLTSKISQRLVE
jgi:hypothetical protein